MFLFSLGDYFTATAPSSSVQVLWQFRLIYLTTITEWSSLGHLLSDSGPNSRRLLRKLSASSYTGLREDVSTRDSLWLNRNEHRSASRRRSWWCTITCLLGYSRSSRACLWESCSTHSRSAPTTPSSYSISLFIRCFSTWESRRCYRSFNITEWSLRWWSPTSGSCARCRSRSSCFQRPWASITL